jgi:hypothetical protein
LKAKRKSILPLFLFSFVFAATLSAQFPQGVYGTIYSADKEPLAGAAVQILAAADSMQIDGGFTNKDGYYSFQRIFPGQYILKATFVGYKPAVRNFRVGDTAVNLGTLRLESAAIAMEKVEVSDYRILATVKGDTTQYSAGNFRTAPDASAENLVEKIPGAELQDGKVKVQGEDVKKVLVDSKPFFGDDPSATLRNIPAEIIDQIQVFDQQSEQAKFTGFDDGETEKTINLITKVQFRNGLFGKATAGAGNETHYQVGGVINRFNKDQRVSVLAQSNNINQQNFSIADLAGVMSSSSRRGGRGGRPGGGPPSATNRTGGNISDFLVSTQGGLTQTHAAGINYSDQFGKKIELTGSYFYNMGLNDANSKIYERSLLPQDSGEVWLSDEKRSSTNQNHRLNLRLTYKISERDELLYVPRLTIQLNDGAQQYLGRRFSEDTPFYSYDNDYSSVLSAGDSYQMALWRHKFEKDGRTLSLRISQSRKTKSGDYEQEIYEHSLLNGVFDTLHQVSNLAQKETSYSGDLSYTEPIGKNGSLQLNYEPDYNVSLSEKISKDYDTETRLFSRPNPLFSSIFENTSHSHRFGGGLRYRKSALMLTSRAYYQLSEYHYSEAVPRIRELKHHYSNFLALFTGRYRFESGNNIHLSARSNTKAPTLDQLQESPDLSNPLEVRAGNHKLNHQVHTDIYGRYTMSKRDKGNYTFLLLGGAVTHDYIGNKTFVAPKDTLLANGIRLERGAKYIEPVNLDGYYSLRSFITRSMPLSWMRSNLNLNLSLNYSRIPGIINGENNFAHAPSASLGAVLSSNISEKFDFTVSSNSSIRYSYNTLPGNIDSRTYYQRSYVKLYWNFWKNAVIRSEWNHSFSKGLSSGFNQNAAVANLSIGFKFLKNNAAEFSLSGNDLFNQSQDLNHIVTETLIRESETNVLGRYVLAQFSYSFRKGNYHGDGGERRPGQGRGMPPG